jgi:hypothetical protein
MLKSDLPAMTGKQASRFVARHEQACLRALSRWPMSGPVPRSANRLPRHVSLKSGSAPRKRIIDWEPICVCLAQRYRWSPREIAGLTLHQVVAWLAVRPSESRKRWINAAAANSMRRKDQRLGVSDAAVVANAADISNVDVSDFTGSGLAAARPTQTQFTDSDRIEADLAESEFTRRALDPLGSLTEHWIATLERLAAWPGNQEPAQESVSRSNGRPAESRVVHSVQNPTMDDLYRCCRVLERAAQRIEAVTRRQVAKRAALGFEDE